MDFRKSIFGRRPSRGHGVRVWFRVLLTNLPLPVAAGSLGKRVAMLSPLFIFAAALLAVADCAKPAAVPVPAPGRPPLARAKHARDLRARGRAVHTPPRPAHHGAGLPAGPDLALECAMRSVAYDMSQRHPTAQRHAADIKASLQVRVDARNPLAVGDLYCHYGCCTPLSL